MFNVTDEQIKLLQQKYLCGKCDHTGILKIKGDDNKIIYDNCTCVKLYKDAYNMLVANIPSAYHKVYHLDTEFVNENCTSVDRIIKYTKKLSNALENGFGFYICGPPGAGKSYLGSFILKAVLEEGYSAYFTYIDDLVAKLMSAMKQGENHYEHTLQFFKTVDFLLIDDIDKLHVDQKEFILSLMTSILKERYHAGKPLLITSNIKKSEFVEFLPDAQAIFEERICEIILTANHRPQILKKITTEFFDE